DLRHTMPSGACCRHHSPDAPALRRRSVEGSDVDRGGLLDAQPLQCRHGATAPAPRHSCPLRWPQCHEKRCNMLVRLYDKGRLDLLRAIKAGDLSGFRTSAPSIDRASDEATCRESEG